ncbi:MAG: hypothetical protein U9R56_07060, partial [candidate division Zixibacteria bacterium]|nr:hypothetical protein [candidate division Zixibacteria bacterium]
MPIQDLLVVVLAILVIFLAVILIHRIKNEKYEKRQMAAVQQLSPADFSSLLNTNAREGVIGRVAGMVSDLLKESFGCELILFLRKKRGLLKYNYSYGVEISSRYEFDIPYSRKLAEQFRTDYLPREISHLRDMEFMPENVCSRLIELGVDTYFPIFWRDNLYGVYFIRNTLETKSVSFNILIASLAQCLSAAYHIKWHEERQNDLQKKLTVPSVFS